MFKVGFVSQYVCPALQFCESRQHSVACYHFIRYTMGQKRHNFYFTDNFGKCMVIFSWLNSGVNCRYSRN